MKFYKKLDGSVYVEVEANLSYYKYLTQVAAAGGVTLPKPVGIGQVSSFGLKRGTIVLCSTEEVEQFMKAAAAFAQGYKDFEPARGERDYGSRATFGSPDGTGSY